MHKITIASGFGIGLAFLLVVANQCLCQTHSGSEGGAATAAGARVLGENAELVYRDVISISSLGEGTRDKVQTTFKDIESKLSPILEELKSLKQKYPGGKNAPPDAVKRFEQLQQQREQIIQEWLGFLQANLTPGQISEVRALRQKRLSPRVVDNHAQPAALPQRSTDTAGFLPLTELDSNKYEGFEGGLYAAAKNSRPAKHEAAGLRLAKSIVPLDKNGIPAKEGKIVIMSVGMSNCTQEFAAFKHMLDADNEKNPQLLLLDAAQGGMTAENVSEPGDGNKGTRYWSVVDEVLKMAGSSREQVQVVWLKEADANPTKPFPEHARKLQNELADIVRIISKRFIHVKLCYVSSRSYGGFAQTKLNPEPYAYESGFAVKWLIDEQINGSPALNYDAHHGSVKAPWLSWGPYLWANGTQPRADGLFYDGWDFGPDGTHPSPIGRQKIAKLLLQFFKTDTTTKSWFLGGS